MQPILQKFIFIQGEKHSMINNNVVYNVEWCIEIQHPEELFKVSKAWTKFQSRNKGISWTCSIKKKYR